MAYIITITLPGQRFSYPAIGNRDALMDDAYDRHGVCGVTIKESK